jgi:hypothetical protein
MHSPVLPVVLHTQLAYTNWVKDRIFCVWESQVGRRVSSIRPGARQFSFVSDQKTDEDCFLAGEFNCIPNRREQPNQWLRTYNQIQYSNRLNNPHENSGGRMTLQEPSSNQQRSPVQPMFVSKFKSTQQLHKFRQRTNVQISEQMSKIKKSIDQNSCSTVTKQNSFHWNVENTYAWTKTLISWYKNESNNIIHLQSIHENQITKES